MYKKIIGIDGKEIDKMILRLSDKAYIPNDSKNKDWREYQKWLKGGNKILLVDK